MVVRKAARVPVPIGRLPDFTPVPRKQPRHDGWTVERQKAVLEALADTGCVAIACRMVNMSSNSFYQLRRQPGAESFRAAADAAQTLGLQPVKDEAFHRAMHGQLVPVFVAGKLMGFRRKKNDRLLMFILRHYGQDAQGRKTTVNYFSTRASAGATSSPSPLRGEGRGEGESESAAASDPSAIGSAKAEASTTTVRTIVTGPAAAQGQLAADDEAAAVLDAFEGVELDETAQAEIRRALEACAERQRALEHDPENDPDRIFVGPEEAGAYLGELEGGTEDDWIEYRSGACPEQGRRGEHRWENLGEGGQAAEIDEVLCGIEERKLLASPVRPELVEGWPSEACAPSPEAPNPSPRAPAEAGAQPLSPRTGKPLKRYKKRTPKAAFTPPSEARKAEAIVEVKAERQAGATAERKRRNRQQKRV